MQTRRSHLLCSDAEGAVAAAALVGSPARGRHAHLPQYEQLPLEGGHAGAIPGIRAFLCPAAGAAGSLARLGGDHLTAPRVCGPLAQPLLLQVLDSALGWVQCRVPCPQTVAARQWLLVPHNSCQP